MASIIFEFLGSMFQLVILAAVLGVVGWQVRKVLASRAASRQQLRLKEIAAKMAATKARQNARLS